MEWTSILYLKGFGVRESYSFSQEWTQPGNTEELNPNLVHWEQLFSNEDLPATLETYVFSKNTLEFLQTRRVNPGARISLSTLTQAAGG